MNKLALLFSFVTLLVLAGCTKPLELPPHDAGFHFKHYQRVKVNANHPPWVGSEIDLKQGERVLVLASGKVTTCRRCGSDSIDQPPNGYLEMRVGERTFFFSFSGKLAGMTCFPICGYYDDFRSAYDGELQFAVRDWDTYPPPKDWYKDNSGSFLLVVFVYDPEQKEGFKRFLRAMIQNNPEDLMFTAQAQAFLK
jgi:predicted small lipoprotein YifL